MINPAPMTNLFDENKDLIWPGNHVFFVKVDNYFEGIKDHYKKILSITECEKADKFFRPEDRKSYLVRKFFLRKTLSMLLKKLPEDIEFEYTKSKKPFIENIPFNITHSNNLIAMVLSRTAVGIDIEFLKDNFSYQVMLDSCFKDVEQVAIESSTNSLLSFYLLWTRKEAVLKANGTGIRNDNLKEVEVLSSPSHYDGQSYRLWSALIFEKYIVSIAWTNETENIYYWTLSH